MKYLRFFSFLFVAALLGACTDEESALGIDLVDSTTHYTGYSDTLYADQAWTQFEDSLLTSNYSFGILGNYSDPVFGSVSATLYTQIALPTNTTSYAFDSAMTIDSVVLSFYKNQLFPDTAGAYAFHFEVKQLAQPLLSDTSYYAFDELPVDESTLFYDATVNVAYSDTMISLVLDSSVNSMLRLSASAEDFIAATKGLRVRITTAGDPGMVSLDFSSAYTCMRAYFHYTYGETTTNGTYSFLMGAGTSHFIHFEHNYSGTLFAGADSLGGGQRLYLEPLGGHNVRLSFDKAIRAFHAAHPLAAIHHAELVMPVAPEAPTLKPDQILLLGLSESGNEYYIDDLLNTSTLRGYDGTFHDDGNYFRMRMSQHLQGLLRKGADPGLVLMLNSRRHAAQRTVLMGNATTEKPKIILVYSE